MIKVRVFGGLGNQMFQYAAGRMLSKKHETPLILNTSYFKSNSIRKFMLGFLSIPNDIIIMENTKFSECAFARKTMEFLKWPKWYFRNYALAYDDRFQMLTANAYLDGYFQSEKYFEAIDDFIRKEFVPSFEFSNAFNKWKQIICKCNSVSIHVRRGDYLNKKNIKVHGVIGLEYYEKAVSILKHEIEKPCFFIFSDDKDWCEKMMLPIVKNGQIIKLNSAHRDIEELCLMSKCQHNIIANSSFSWWGAWLNNKKNKRIIYPKNWSVINKNVFSLFPDSWNGIV